MRRDPAGDSKFTVRLKAAAAHLRCAATEDAVAEACRHKANRVADAIDLELRPYERLTALADHFRVHIDTARTTAELDELVESYARRGEFGFALRRDRFDHDLLAAVLRRVHPRPGERIFAALVDARAEKERMAFFSKAHEIAHPALEPQLEMDFREEMAKRSAWEQLVDRVGSEMVFDGVPWHEELRRLRVAKPTLDMNSLVTLRNAMAPEASLTAVALAAANTEGRPILVIVGRLGSSLRDPEPLLRVQRVIPNRLGLEHATFIHPNRRIPLSSPLSQAFVRANAAADFEDLRDWIGGDGQRLPRRRVWTAAQPTAEGVLGIVDFGSQSR